MISFYSYIKYNIGLAELLDSNISFGINFGKNLDFTIFATLIIKKLSKSLFFKKPITSHDFSNLYLHIKKIM